jgi:hypothetical protein
MLIIVFDVNPTAAFVCKVFKRHGAADIFIRPRAEMGNKAISTSVEKNSTPVETIPTPVKTISAPVNIVFTTVEAIATPVKPDYTPVKTIYTSVEGIPTPVKTISTTVKMIFTPVKMSEMVKKPPSLVMETARFWPKLDAWTIGGSARVSRAVSGISPGTSLDKLV